jgi:alpha-L-rhamnosidase
MGAFNSADILAQIAEILQKPDDQRKYNAIREDIRDAVYEYYDPQTGCFAPESQTLQALALYYDICRDEDRSKVLEYLESDIADKNGHFSTGTIATRKLFRALADEGRMDLALDVLRAPGYPGFADMMDQGVTAVWERWDGRSSLNHPAYGGVGVWFFRSLAGIRPDWKNPGFRQIIFKPDALNELEWVKSEYDSIRGTVKAGWTTENGVKKYKVYVPVGSTGRVYLPEDREIVAPKDLERDSDQSGRSFFAVPSGEYTFVLK